MLHKRATTNSAGCHTMGGPMERIAADAIMQQW